MTLEDIFLKLTSLPKNEVVEEEPEEAEEDADDGEYENLFTSDVNEKEKTKREE